MPSPFGRFAMIAAIVAAGVATVGVAVTQRAKPKAGAAAVSQQPPAKPMPIEKTLLGVNLGSLPYWTHDRMLANLVAGANWKVQGSLTKGGWEDYPAALLDDSGNIKSLPQGNKGILILARPAAPFQTKIINCTFSGTGRFEASGQVVIKSSSANALRLTMTWSPSWSDRGWISLLSMSDSDPVRNIDCREEGLARDALFAPDFLNFMKDFGAVRYMDWQNINANLKAPSWAAIANTKRANQLGEDGVTIDLLVALANEAGVDPWFVMPYNASDAYMRNFATYVHDHLNKERTAYVEFGNEIWNPGFPAAQQAADEGMAAGLAKSPFEARLKRYAQKATHALGLWSSVYTDRPKALVRVISGQAACTWCSEQILGFPDAAKAADAFAIAPYIQHNAYSYSLNSIDKLFLDLDKSVDEAIALAVEQRAIAGRFGLKLVAYEAGQHLGGAAGGSNMDFVRAIQTDPRMGHAYTRYLNGWRSKVGGTIMHYSSTGPISQFGSWGLREYPGQPLSETPKLAAVKSFVAENR
jgi:F0F1-type ATP synthase membrane subunit c/vacuolar-type H+-ATPase subunit K